MNIIEIINSIQGTIIVESLLLSVFFFSNKKGGYFLNLFLSVYLLMRCIQLTNGYLNRNLEGYSSQLISHLAGASFGPLLLLFVMAMTSNYPLNKEKVLRYVLPPFLYITIWYLFLENSIGNTHTTQLLDIPMDAMYLGYVVYGLALLHRAKRLNLNKIKGDKPFKLMSFLLYFSLFQVSSYYLILYFIKVGNTDFMRWSVFLYYFLVLLLTNGLIFFMLKYPYLSFNPKTLRKKLHEAQLGKYDYSDLTENEALTILDKLEKVIQSNDLYKNSNLKLEDVAHGIGVEPKDLSQSMNQYLGKSFKEYLNEIKVKEAARLLKSSSHSEWRINEIMYEAGFNTKSSFNTLFKKIIGSTPKEYRQQITKA